MVVKFFNFIIDRKNHKNKFTSEIISQQDIVFRQLITLYENIKEYDDKAKQLTILKNPSKTCGKNNVRKY